MESAVGGLGFREWKRMCKLPPSVGDDTWAAKGIRILQLEFRQRKITWKTEWKVNWKLGVMRTFWFLGCLCL